MSTEALPVIVHPKVGPITTIRDDGLQIGAHDFGDLLVAHDPRELDRVDPLFKRPIRYMPKVPDLILRWNNSFDRPLPVSPDDAVPFMVEANQQFDRLQELGMVMLRRNIFVVEHDIREKRPIVYTIAERHNTDSLEAILDDVPLRLKPTIQAQLLSIAGALTSYYEMPETDNQALYDLDYGQCAQDGPLLDYDPSMYKGIDAKRYWVEYLHNWTEQYIRPSPAQEEVIGKISALQQRLSATAIATA